MMTKFSRLTSFFILAAGAQTIGPNDNQLNDTLKMTYSSMTINRMTLGRITLIITQNRMSFRIMPLCQMTPSLMTQSIMKQNQVSFARMPHYAECPYAE
jgi:hypothetical protein